MIDPATAERILSFEREPSDRRTPASGFNAPTATEAFIYLGLVVLAIGVFATIVTSWEELDSWARVAVVAVPAGVALVAGLVMRQFDADPVRRGGELAWFAAVALFAGLLLVSGEEIGPGLDEPGPRAIAGLGAAAYAAFLWAFSPSHAQVITFAASVAFLGQMLGSWPESFDQHVAGLTMLALGAALLAGVEIGLVPPRSTGRLMFALLVAAGAYEMQLQSSWPWEPWTVVAGAALVVLSIRRTTFTFMLLGMVAIFLGLVTMVIEHLGDRIGAELSLILCGAAIIAGVLVLTQIRKSMHWGRT